MNKNYLMLLSIPTFEERLEYLKLDGRVGEDTFGFNRMFSQMFYKSPEWKQIRQKIVARDLGCDLGISDREIFGKILIHHINPITIDDISNSSDKLLNPNNLICVSNNTHQYIHYGIKRLEESLPPIRTRNDMCPWRK